ncbi:class I SAM-dependent methyltransferase [Legionella pneumophila]|uniref:class I SAM-dependent methyltransferase n=1 Tax=Legionella pneumophila TaxID=446 RepID=UPI0007708321|nr:class I SAM-dependent methyltransferase [Legionella pneumophila]PYB42226.1 class I SAM-dependent methyltransferase [Legionella pneumophila]PYB60847.1 class I SAM-dependent methyltransferase [Legionella pneumophila]TID57291.1 class I SAM-dependent methyltransferase [Legionella pneumophila]TID64203.1 class I SAM-dependent methyltransferase [Legionella pneumophila]TID72881.1 class I SAM-dependent methyltransferase [Legionella pneumophila]
MATASIKKGLWSPEHYFKNSSTQFGHARSLLENYPFKGNESILDIGCGDGKITADLAGIVPNGKIVGLDNNLSTLEFARNKFNAETHPNLEFIEGDITDIEKLGDFDLIISFSCLHFVKDQPAALTNIKKNLADNGQIILMLYRKCRAQWGALDDVSTNPKWAQFFENYDPGYYEYLPDCYQILLNESGLGQFKSAFTKEEILTYENLEIFKNFIKGWLPHLNVLPSELHDEFLGLFLKKYLFNLDIFDTVGKIDIPFVRLIVR